MGFIFSVLSKNGYRKWFIRKWGEEKGFRIYEAILGFIFFNIGASIGYVAIASSSEIFSFVPKILFGIIIGIIFFGGLFVKMWATKAASVEIYYWKDMFLGRKISKFVKSGPYKYFNSPMYGVGQIQGYAFAVWYGSVLGILIMVLYQILIFTFLHNVENEFIQRVHIQRAA
jgi:protein-S-isoprenylcysteine O-methyltransferase Ste14